MAELLHYAGGDAMRQALKFRKSKSKQASLWLADPSNKQKIQAAWLKIMMHSEP